MRKLISKSIYQYNDNASAGSATTYAVKTRHEAIKNEFIKYNK